MPLGTYRRMSSSRGFVHADTSTDLALESGAFSANIYIRTPAGKGALNVYPAMQCPSPLPLFTARGLHSPFYFPWSPLPFLLFVVATPLPTARGGMWHARPLPTARGDT